MSTVDAELDAIDGWLPGLRSITRMAFLAVALLAFFGPAASARAIARRWRWPP
jgi:hypothetical protein